MFCRLPLLGLLLILPLELPGSAALADPPRSETLAAGLWGGDIRSLAIHPEDPNLMAAGTSAGQVYLSRDGGRSWNDAGLQVPFADWVVGTLRFDPHRPERLWVGLWGVWGSGLVAVSDDLGATWRERRGPVDQGGAAKGVLPREPVYDLALVPEHPDVLYAGTLSGVWVTRDAGGTWSPLTSAYPEVHHVSSLLVLPGSPQSGEPDTLLAGTWRRAYRSDDGGLTWHGVFAGMELDSEVFQLRPVPGRSGELWASTCGWVYHSPGPGERWTRFKQGLPERRTPSFAVLEDGRLLAGTIAGLYVSGDVGQSWQRRTDSRLSIRAIAYHPRQPDRIVLGTEGAGVWLSSDGGSSFAPSSRGMTNLRVEALLAVRGIGGDSGNTELLAAVHHAGPLSGIYRSIDGGLSFEREPQDLPPVLSFTDTGDRIYAATEAGLFERDPETLRFQPVAQGALLPDDGPRDRPIDGRFDTAGEGQVLWDRSEIWYRANEHLLWKRVAAGEVVRLVATGDPRWPVLLVGPDEVRLFDAFGGRLEAPLRLFFPARDVKAAAIVGDRLLLGTTGHGLVGLALEPDDGSLGAREVAR